MNVEEILQRLKKTSIEIIFQEQSSEKLPVGASKFGGKPDLPPDFSWKYFLCESYIDAEIKQRPLSFLAQINCAEIPDIGEDQLLPKTGILYFFYELSSERWGFDLEDKGCSQVFYYDGPISNLISTNIPEEMEKEFIFPEIPISFQKKSSFPDWQELMADDREIDCEKYEEERSKKAVNVTEECSKLLGYADIIQGNMKIECELISRGINIGHGYPQMSKEERDKLEQEAQRWQLLFQLDSLGNDEFELMFGDCGRIYFYITKEELKQKRFDRSWLILQCY